MGRFLFAACLAWWLGTLAVPAAEGRAGRVAREWIGGREYVSVAGWARQNGWQSSWEVPGKRLRLRSGSQSLVFERDSKESQVNGVVVFLLYPVAARDGGLWVAAQDWSVTLNPLLVPARNERRVPIMRVCLDPGHGGRDPGNEEGRTQEKHLVMLLAREVRSMLTNAGLQVVMTRQTDSFVELEDRPAIAARRDADLLVSLHFNAAIAGKASVRGVEVFCLTPAGAPSTYASGRADLAALPGNRRDAKNLLLAYQIQKSMVRSLPVEDRGVKRARFAVLKTASMPAVLVEAGFMSHPTESRKLLEASYRRQLARAITDGILAYKRLVER